jgi:SAM-dependent methyltransferase
VPSSISFDRAADSYDASRGYPPEVADAIGAAMFQAGGGQPGSRFLELGIGTGRIAIPLLARGVDVTGVDISPRMATRLRDNLAARQAELPSQPWGQLDVRMADMTALPFEANTFDAVVAVHVLHLVPEWTHALDESLRVMLPGGALLLGQDYHPTRGADVIQRVWATIMGEMGVDVSHIGAGYDRVVAELRARGLPMEETVAVRWIVRTSLRDQLNYVAQRGSSRTWRVPDVVFAESVRRLQEWAEREYGAELDAAREEQAEFLLARTIKPH